MWWGDNLMITTEEKTILDVSNDLFIYKETEKETKHYIKEAQDYSPPSKLNYLKKQIEYWKIKEWQLFTHHPICKRYKEHYFTIANLHLCVGCTSMYSAMSLIFLTFIFIEVSKNYLISLLILFYASIASSLFHLFIKPEKKYQKAFLRFLAGLGIAAYFIIIMMTKNALISAVLVAIALASFDLYGKIRNKQHKTYCNCCNLYNECNPWKSVKIKLLKLQMSTKKSFSSETYILQFPHN